MRVIIIDDDQLVVMSLKTILEADAKVQVVGVGYDGADAVTLFAEHKPDVVLMDIQMKHISGIEAAKEILRQNAYARILFLTTFSDDSYITQALEAGAKGYILKQDFHAILPALLAVDQGQSVFGGEIVSRLPTLQASSGKFDADRYGISEKELEIMALVGDGKSNKEIAEELFLSEGTVRNYISTILDKLSLRDRTQLAVFYLKKCLLAK